MTIPAFFQPIAVAAGVDGWLVHLDDQAAQAQNLDLLDAAERERAARYHFDVHRRRFVAGRAALRCILAGYCPSPPWALEFAYGSHGKPELAACPQITFNMANADELALVVVTTRRRVGVDLERLRPLPDVEELARSTFTPAEVARLRGLPVTQRTEAFLNGWTRKEAYVKAIGTGLATPPQSFEVSLAPGAAPRLVRLPAADDLGRWRLHAVRPAPDWVGAVVVEADARQESVE
jgi:4'-phosphopantetheinyl transferase